MAVMTGGCSQIDAWRYPEVAACEAYISALLNAPTTYKRSRVFISDSRLPLAYWTSRSREILGSSASLAKDYDEQQFKDGGIRSVTIEYDAANGFGVPTRGVSNCKYEMSSFVDNEFTSEPSSSSAELQVASVKAGLAEGDDVTCCESKRTMKRLAEFEAKAEFLTQRVLN